ncbi:MAG: arginine decarboxylase, pyruvoyl-dependent [Peptococcaceae bacterium]|jgi:arginine decarboxylase|nr:arginine decarboxylase, pyruvoyl-dependent [Peptococcaceae bacterium]MDH7524850.1 arginine decarboxylase, pyruvoyl-dependent [Peptococcaceae bacterium]
MLPLPTVYKLAAASSEGESPLTAFDRALLKAGIGNVNLVRISSILPPGAVYRPDMEIPPGSMAPTAYGHIISEKPGQVISAAAGVGIAEDGFGVIMEHSGFITKDEAEQDVRRMIEEAFRVRGLELKEIRVAATTHRVDKVACALAAVILWY